MNPEIRSRSPTVLLALSCLRLVGFPARWAYTCRVSLLPDAPSSTCAMLMARFRLALPSLNATSGILPADSFASASGVMSAVFSMSAILTPRVRV